MIWWITAGTPGRDRLRPGALAAALQPGLAGVLPIEALRERAVRGWPATRGGWWCWIT